MADEDHGTVVFGQRLDQRLAAFHVEVVGRLVKDQQVRRVDGGEQQGKTGFLAAGQPADSGFGLIRAKAETGEAGAQAGLAFVGAQAHDVLQGGFVDMQLVDLMLREIADAEFGGLDEFAVGCFEFTG